MHRSYHPILPSQNKFLQKRWDDIYYNEHRRKVRDAVPVVNTRAPATFIHLHLRLKKLQLEEERLATIERDNRILLEKMSYIMRTKGQVDNWNSYGCKSLNREKRQRELLRVTRDNQQILYRINMRKPQYSHQDLQLDWEKNQRFMDSISAYPVDWWVKEKRTPRKLKRNTKSANEVKREENKKDESQQKDVVVVEKQLGEEQGKRDEKKNQQENKGKKKKQKEEKSKKRDEGTIKKKEEKKTEEVKVKEQLEVPVEDEVVEQTKS